MGDIVYYLAITACVVTAGVLVLGVLGFGKGTASPRRQNRLMRLRIAAQFVAVILIVLTVLLLRGE